jgi:hypothetical protein
VEEVHHQGVGLGRPVLLVVEDNPEMIARELRKRYGED